MAHHDQLILQQFRHWTLYLANDQYYLGRAYAWLNRPGDMQRITDLTHGERTELWDDVVPTYEKMVHLEFAPDWMNYLWLGNDFHVHKGHGHLHLIPRYAAERSVGGLVFRDDQWGGNYAPFPKGEYPDDLLFAIRDGLLESLVEVLLHP